MKENRIMKKGMMSLAMVLFMMGPGIGREALKNILFDNLNITL